MRLEFDMDDSSGALLTSLVEACVWLMLLGEVADRFLQTADTIGKFANHSQHAAVM